MEKHGSDHWLIFFTFIIFFWPLMHFCFYHNTIEPLHWKPIHKFCVFFYSPIDRISLWLHEKEINTSLETRGILKMYFFYWAWVLTEKAALNSQPLPFYLIFTCHWENHNFYFFVAISTNLMYSGALRKMTPLKLTQCVHAICEKGASNEPENIIRTYSMQFLRQWYCLYSII